MPNSIWILSKRFDQWDDGGERAQISDPCLSPIHVVCNKHQLYHRPLCSSVLHLQHKILTHFSTGAILLIASVTTGEQTLWY